ncbi:MAG: hypothetical protein ACK5V3_00800 [Bdellovibrionales bacterium]
MSFPGSTASVSAMVLDGNTLYVGGYFTQVGGVARSHLAAIDTNTGLPLSWDPQPDSSVNSMVKAGSSLYLGGSFSNVGGQTRSKLASVDMVSGVVYSWNPGEITGTTFSAVYDLQVLDSSVYVGGSFTGAAGVLRNNLTLLSIPNGTDLWAP